MTHKAYELNATVDLLFAKRKVGTFKVVQVAFACLSDEQPCNLRTTDNVKGVLCVCLYLIPHL